MRIGDYIRTKYGIAKIIDIHERKFVNLRTGKYYKDLEYELDKAIIPNYEENTIFCDKEDIIKCKEEPIDLIQVGDYVNGEKITRVIPEDVCGDEVLDYQHIFVGDKEIYKENIKSIVTKEQFESMEYKVVEQL